MPARKKPIRVAIIGGGCAAMTAGFELTRPEHQGRYEVTVYQLGWRLGGKGASGRGVEGRIEEHGLHLWMGFYENAFRLMRECYGELKRDPDTCPIATWQDAFKPAPHVAVTDHRAGGGWEAWMAYFPPMPGLPGDPLHEHNPFSVRGYLQQAVVLLMELLRSANARQPLGESEAPRSWGSLRAPAAIVDAINTVLRYGQLATAAALFEATDLLRAVMGNLFPQEYRQFGGPELVLKLIDAIADVARQQLQALVSGDTELRRIWQVADLVLAILRGATLSGLVMDPRGFDALNEYDWREWLRLHGASDQTLDSGFVRGIYDLVFAYEDGDVNRPALAAGVALRGAMRMFFTYRGSLFWHMGAGMGDIVFAPLYEVLKRRGVRFEFFHRLRNVKLSPKGEPGRPYVQALEFDVQAHIKGEREYQPLIDVKGVPSWPARPDYEQLVDGSTLEREGWSFEGHWEKRKAGTKSLKVSRDFDFVVLGVGAGALPYVASELIAREPRWKDMVKHVKTVATQAFQTWMREDMDALGWSHPPVNLSGYVEPFDTWADMRHLIPREAWTRPIKGIAYFCSVLPDVGSRDAVDSRSFHEQRHLEVRDSAANFLAHHVGVLWPKAVDDQGRFRWNVLAWEKDGTASGRRLTGEKRFHTQYWTANINPSDRYVLSVPGSSKYRLSPLDMTFDNLTLAGDWTQSGLDSGCVESAVMSGLLAAHALSHSPPLEDIVGYDHP